MPAKNKVELFSVPESNAHDADHMIRFRGGILVYQPKEGGPGTVTPVNDENGKPYVRPVETALMGEPRKITSHDECQVIPYEKVETLEVKFDPIAQDFDLATGWGEITVCDESVKLVEAALKSAGPGSFYTYACGGNPLNRFLTALLKRGDKITVFRLGQPVPLLQWLKDHPA